MLCPVFPPHHLSIFFRSTKFHRPIFFFLSEIEILKQRVKKLLSVYLFPFFAWQSLVRQSAYLLGCVGRSVCIEPSVSILIHQPLGAPAIFKRLKFGFSVPTGRCQKWCSRRKHGWLLLRSVTWNAALPTTTASLATPGAEQRLEHILTCGIEPTTFQLESQRTVARLPRGHAPLPSPKKISLHHWYRRFSLRKSDCLLFF